MRQSTSVDGMRWRPEGMAAPASDQDGVTAHAAPPEGEAARVALLVCVTCEGEARQVTIRAPADQWRELDSAELCRLIREAEAMV